MTSDMSRHVPKQVGARRSQRGFSLVEVLMATLLLGYAVSSLDALFIAGQHKAMLNSNPLTARLLANEIRLLAQLLPKDPSGTAGATATGEVLALDSLRGAVFNPPILANLTEYEGMDDWTQTVSVKVAAMDDPTAVGTDMPAEGLHKEAASLYEVEVTISFQQEDVETWSWWIRP